jgi:hypothetical protein
VERKADRVTTVEIAVRTPYESEQLRIGPALVSKVVSEAAALDEALAAREATLGVALERDLFGETPPARVLPSDVRAALAERLERALRVWSESPIVARAPAETTEQLSEPLRRIASSVRAAGPSEEVLAHLFPDGTPERSSTADLLRAFRLAAARETRALVRLVALVPSFERWEPVIEHEIAGRVSVVVKLWVIALRWFALAASRGSAPQATSFQQLLTKWQCVERGTRQLFDA